MWAMYSTTLFCRLAVPFCTLVSSTTEHFSVLPLQMLFTGLKVFIYMTGNIMILSLCGTPPLSLRLCEQLPPCGFTMIRWSGLSHNILWNDEYGLKMQMLCRNCGREIIPHHKNNFFWVEVSLIKFPIWQCKFVEDWMASATQIMGSITTVLLIVCTSLRSNKCVFLPHKTFAKPIFKKYSKCSIVYSHVQSSSSLSLLVHCSISLCDTATWW